MPSFDHVGEGGGQGGTRFEHVDAWMDVRYDVGAASVVVSRPDVLS